MPTAEELVLASQQNQGRTPTIGMEGLMNQFFKSDIFPENREMKANSALIEEMEAEQRRIQQEQQMRQRMEPSVMGSLMESTEDLGGSVYEGGRALGEGTYDAGQSLGEGAFNAQKMLEEMGESVGKQGLMDMYKNFFSGMGK